MRLIHVADLHLGQVIYQTYERADEHRHFFSQLRQWCVSEQPDVLLVAGDIFDIQQPSAATWKMFTDSFVSLRRAVPSMAIVIVAGNHDSPSRLESHNGVWQLADVRLVGAPLPAVMPAGDAWMERYIVRLPSGYVVALPFMTGERRAQVQALLDSIACENGGRLPVVMMAHQAVEGCDLSGHDVEVGTLRSLPLSSYGTGYDYLALGHIHKPQTLGHPDDAMAADVTYAAPVARYAGSALHVSCDEAYPHTVSVVDVQTRGGDVRIRQLRIDELRHFHVLPSPTEVYATADEAIAGVRSFASGQSGYFRLHIDASATLPSDFGQTVYAAIEPRADEVRYNPKILWEGAAQEATTADDRPHFEVAELQQMTDPFLFIERTIEQYPDLEIGDVRDAFGEIAAELARMDDDETAKRR